MIASRRLSAGLLSWYLAIGLALPALDALLYHRDVELAVVHVEQADSTDCHRERCSLESTTAPQALAAALLPAIVADAGSPDPVSTPHGTLLRDERAARPFGPRAPPHHS
jgi:hypothetical protein